MKGLTILVTRPRRQAAGLAGELRRLGARVLAAPAIRIVPPSSWAGLDRALRRLRTYDALVFTSANGVSSFFARARRVLGRAPGRPPRVYAIGPGTAGELRRRGWRGVSVPETHEGEALARHLGAVRGKRILIPRAAVARAALPKALARKGARVDLVEAYRTLPDEGGLERIRQAVRKGESDLVTFTSTSTVEAFVSAVGEGAARRFFRGRAKAASIGPVTSRALRRHGIRRLVEASRYTTEGLVAAILERARHGRH